MAVEENETMIMLNTKEKPSGHGSTISFKSLNYRIQLGKCSRLLCVNEREKAILIDLNGIFPPGMNAILGPTGSGKSSLLDLLANRKNRQDLTGELLLDGQIYPNDINCRIGYVVQDDILSETLTVRENLMFSANLRLSGKENVRRKNEIVDLVISQLGLEKCAHSKIGHQGNRKVSGGERKRTNIGMELVLSPTVLLLDEPTSGKFFFLSSFIRTFSSRFGFFNC